MSSSKCGNFGVFHPQVTNSLSVHTTGMYRNQSWKSTLSVHTDHQATKMLTHNSLFNCNVKLPAHKLLQVVILTLKLNLKNCMCTFANVCFFNPPNFICIQHIWCESKRSKPITTVKSNFPHLLLTTLLLNGTLLSPPKCWNAKFPVLSVCTSTRQSYSNYLESPEKETNHWCTKQQHTQNRSAKENNS